MPCRVKPMLFYYIQRLFCENSSSWERCVVDKSSYTKKIRQTVFFVWFFFKYCVSKDLFSSQCLRLSQPASFRNPVLHSPTIQEFQMLAVLSAPLFDKEKPLNINCSQPELPPPRRVWKYYTYAQRVARNSVHLFFKKQTFFFFPVRNCSEEKSSSFVFFSTGCSEINTAPANLSTFIGV